MAREASVAADSPSEKKTEEGPKKMVDKIAPASSRAPEDPEEGVEVVLDTEGAAVISDSPERPSSDQNVFRRPQAVRPRPMRAPHHPHGPPPPHAYMHGSGSWGYPPHPEYGPPPHAPPYPVPPYNPSGSFEEAVSYHHRQHPAAHYSPHVHYPPPGGRYPGQDVNVVSPHHKAGEYRPPATPQHPYAHHQPRSYYQYPPASPVLRPGSGPAAPPRVHQYAMRRGEQQHGYPKRGDRPPLSSESPWHPYHGSGPSPPIVNESSFDSGLVTRDTASAPPTPQGSHHPPPPPPPPGPEAFYGGGGSWGSFDSAAAPPPQFDDARYYGYPPESPYGPYSPVIHHSESFPPPPPPGGYSAAAPYSLSYDEDDSRMMDYSPDRRGHSPKGPPSRKKVIRKTSTPVMSNKHGSNKQDMLLPKAAEEVDFEVTDPPMEPVLPQATESSCDSVADVNGYDVLCGRGGGTNSQVGNRRFRQLVQDFQPTYLLARRKEKPLLARTIVLIIRKRGGRFLKKDEETGALFDVGDTKAEAKTSQALREGLDVRATKSAASDHLKKKKKKKDASKSLADGLEDSEYSPEIASSRRPTKGGNRPPDSPPTLPRLQGDRQTGLVHPHSPEQAQYRKRRRMRPACDVGGKFFPDFCPPRADIRPGVDEEDDGVVDGEYVNESVPNRGCAGIALDIVTGAATGSFCLGPTGWNR